MSRTDRNAPCPCGSGRKYKKCCLPVDELYALDRRATACLDQGDEPGALAALRQLFDRALAVLPAHGDRVAHLLEACIPTLRELLAHYGDPAEVLSRLETLASQDRPRRGHWLQRLGQELVRAGRAAEGVARAREGLLATDPADPWLWLGLAEVHLAARDPHGTLDAVRQGLAAAAAAPAGVIRRGDDDVRALLHLTAFDAWNELDQPEEAEAEWLAAGRYDPDAARQAAAVARMWIRLGRPDRAEAWRRQVPSPRADQYLAGLACWASGQHAAARAIWQPFLAGDPDGEADLWWVEAQVLAGDLERVAFYLGDTVSLPFYRNLLEHLLTGQPLAGNRLSRDQAWIAQLAAQRPDRPAPTPAGALLVGLYQEEELDEAVHRAYDTHGVALVQELLAALTGPPGPRRQAAYLALLALEPDGAARLALQGFLDNHDQPAGSRGVALDVLEEWGGDPNAYLGQEPNLDPAAETWAAENLAIVGRLGGWPARARADFTDLSPAGQVACLAALGDATHPADQAFVRWVAQAGRDPTVREQAQRLCRPADPDALLAEARRAFWVQDLARAAACLEVAAAHLPPDDPRGMLTHLQLAMARVDQGDVRGALAAIKRGVAVAAGSPVAQVAAKWTGDQDESGTEDGAQQDGAMPSVDDVAKDLARREQGEPMADLVDKLWAVYLRVTPALPDLDRPPAWAAALCAVAAALVSWNRGGRTGIPVLDPEVVGRLAAAAGAVPEEATFLATHLWAVLGAGTDPWPLALALAGPLAGAAKG